MSVLRTGTGSILYCSCARACAGAGEVSAIAWHRLAANATLVASGHADGCVVLLLLGTQPPRCAVAGCARKCLDTATARAMVCLPHTPE